MGSKSITIIYLLKPSCFLCRYKQILEQVVDFAVVVSVLPGIEGHSPHHRWFTFISCISRVNVSREN